MLLRERHSRESSVDHTLMGQLTANHGSPEDQGVHLHFPVEVVDRTVCHHREDQIQALWRNLLEPVH